MRKLMIVGVMAASAAVATPAAAADEEEFIEIFQGYLTISEKFLGLASRPEAAVFFAVEGIVEIHEARGEQAEAIPILTESLALYPENQTVRNVIRFKLRDLYRDTGQSERAVTELRTIIEENR